MAFTDIMQTRALLVAPALLSIVIFIFCFPFRKTNLISESMFFILIMLITSLINLFFTQNNFGGSLTLIGSLVLSVLYINFGSKKLTVWIVASYLITIGYISFHLVVLGTHENLIYDGLSRNHVGFAVVFWTIFLLFHLNVNHNYVSLIPPIIGLVLSFFLVGRTSLIVSALLLVLVFYHKFKKSPITRLVIFSVVLGFGYFLWLKFESDLLTETNLDAGLDTPRWELWSIYWEHIDIVNLFTGIDVNILPMYEQFGGNPHNSFIKFHSRVGIGSFVFIFLYFVSVFKYLITRKYYIFWLLMLLTLRAFFDSDILIGNFDFIFFIITFYWIKNEQ